MSQHQPVTTRRIFLGLALGLCGVAADAPAANGTNGTSGADHEPLHAKLQAALGLDARAVSVWFTASSWRAPSGLAGHLDLERISAASLSELRAHLRERIKADYDAGRIVCAYGWRLAVTEAAVLSVIYDGRRA